MLAKTLQVSVLSVAVLGAGAGLVAAQSGSEPAAETTSAPAEAAPSSEEMLAKARGVLAQLDASSQNVSQMLRQAKEAKDAVKILCLDDKLSQLDVAKRSAADRVDSLGAAISSGNGERAEHDFAVIGALEERANALSAEANQCIGEEKGFVGGSSLKVIVDPSIPQNDTWELPQTPVIVMPPQAASPTF